MNKLKINATIVVEGNTDISFLSNFIDANFIKTNGSEISIKTLNLIKKTKERENIIILTDPDNQGKRIRKIINDNVPGCYNCFLNKESCIKNNKVGVAESTKKEIIQKLKELKLLDTQNNTKKITIKDLIDINLIGFDSQNKRNYLSNYFGFDYCNNKSFIKRINQLQISKKELIEGLKAYGEERKHL